MTQSNPAPTPPESFNIHIPAPINNADGSVSYETQQGAKITTNPDGSISLDFRRIKNIGIRNIIDVHTHSINTVLGMVSHFVKFHNSGELRFAYNQAGQLIELSFTRLHVNITDDNEVMFSTSDPKAAA
jgi:hypothetical protein